MGESYHPQFHFLKSCELGNLPMCRFLRGKKRRGERKGEREKGREREREKGRDEKGRDEKGLTFFEGWERKGWFFGFSDQK